METTGGPKRMKTPPAVSIYQDAKLFLEASPSTSAVMRKKPLQSSEVSVPVDASSVAFVPIKSGSSSVTDHTAMSASSTLINETGDAHPFMGEESPRRGMWRRRSSSSNGSNREGSFSSTRPSQQRTFDLHSRLSNSPGVPNSRKSHVKKDERQVSVPPVKNPTIPIYEFSLWKLDPGDDDVESFGEDRAEAKDKKTASENAADLLDPKESRSSSSPKKNRPSPNAGKDLLRRSISPRKRKEQPRSTSTSPSSFKIGSMLGSGTFGKVFKALNCSTGALFAVKKMALDGAAQMQIAALRREVILLQKLQHENIVRYLGTERRNRHELYIFLEFVPGGSIASLLKEFGPFSESTIGCYTHQILKGVEYLHDKKILHRDIKGANVLISDCGRVKLVDFGCSKQLAGLRTNSLDESLRALRGSIPYMAPEVVRQSGHSFAADIWSVGATVIEMATAKRPWPDLEDNLSALFHIATANSPPPLPKGVSNSLSSFLCETFKLVPSERGSAKSLLKHQFISSATARKPFD